MCRLGSYPGCHLRKRDALCHWKLDLHRDEVFTHNSEELFEMTLPLPLHLCLPKGRGRDTTSSKGCLRLDCCSCRSWGHFSSLDRWISSVDLLPLWVIFFNILGTQFEVTLQFQISYPSVPLESCNVMGSPPSHTIAPAVSSDDTDHDS